MKKSVYNPSEHKGAQPIRVLAYNIIEWFEKTYPDFIIELENEVNHNGLQKGISYLIGNNPITEVAFVDGNKKIAIEETFLSYLWSISYGLVVIYDNGILQPTLNGTYNGKLNPNDEKTMKALGLFKYGLSLIGNFSEWDKASLPNPEEYDNEEDEYVEKVNSVFLHAIKFILCHEFAHVYLGHVDADNSGIPASDAEIKKDEYSADNYAISTVLQGVTDTQSKTNICMGVVAGLCALLFLDKELTRTTHPDSDLRIQNAIDQFNLAEDDNIWGIACLGFQFWATKYNIDLELPTEKVNTYKELCLYIFKKTSSLKMN